MLTGMIVFIVVILFFVFFVVYKRDMVMKMFSLNAAAPAGEFQQELEKTVDVAIGRLEQQIAHLELLLDEADAKIEQLDTKLQAAERLLASAPAIAAEPVPPPQPRTFDVRLAPEAPPPVSAPPPPNPEETPTRETPNADRRRLIITMAEQGYSVTEIAKATGTGKGEIMLLLQLNKK